MLKFIKCELWKLKRKRFIQLVIASAFLFPIPFTILINTPSMMKRYTSKIDAFNELWGFVISYGIQFLLPCILGIIAAMLFFMERDNNTFKNLRTIPVTSRQMILAKISVLFIVSIIYCVTSTVVSILFGIATLEVSGIAYKLWLSVVMGVFITAGTLPLIIVIVFFSRSYIFSVLFCAFYSILNLSATFLYNVLPKSLFWLLPTPLTLMWWANNIVGHNIKVDLNAELIELIPSTQRVIVTLGIMALLSIEFIIYLYKKREE